MLTKLYIKFTMGFNNWKYERRIYQTVKFICDDCGKKGLVLRQISVLNLAFWLLLGLGTAFLFELFGAGWGIGSVIGFLVWYISTAINVKLNKPQCRHCKGINVRMPEKEEKDMEVETTETI